MKLEARTMKCDKIEFGIGISAGGKTDVLMMPMYAGIKLLPDPIALTPDIARKIGKELQRLADNAQGRQLIAQPQFTKIT